MADEDSKGLEKQGAKDAARNARTCDVAFGGKSRLFPKLIRNMVQIAETENANLRNMKVYFGITGGEQTPSSDNRRPNYQIEVPKGDTQIVQSFRGSNHKPYGEVFNHSNLTREPLGIARILLLGAFAIAD